MLANWYGGAIAALRGQITLGRLIADGLTTVEEATELGWGVVLIFPALTDLPIDAGLLPVPDEFQVYDDATGQAYYNVPPNALLGVGKTVGPSCGLYPSPYGSTRGIVRWGTYGYSGCVRADQDGGAAQYEAPALPSPTPTPVPPRRTPTPTPRPAPPTATPAPLNGVLLLRKTSDLTVSSGDECRLEWQVRNTGTTTWRANGANGYKVRFRGAYEGELTFGNDVAPGQSYTFWLTNGCAWATAGTTSTFIAELTHDNRPFGFEFRIVVTMGAAVARRGALPYYPNYSGCDYGPNSSQNAYFELQAAWDGPASNAEISALIDRGISGIQAHMASRSRVGFDNSYFQRCIDYLNSGRALLR